MLDSAGFDEISSRASQSCDHCDLS